ncbi:MAG: recombinase family protein, partial [Alphaproteobacteria bacterium]
MTHDDRGIQISQDVNDAVIVTGYNDTVIVQALDPATPGNGPARAVSSHPDERAGRVSCAVYTRKSSEEGLEMEFNSLDAQREACEAFVASQKAEGWLLVPDRYDDGGISGGTLERPALKRLMADIEAGKVDCVVVYKIDRLTRSLTDFAKLVDVFDRRHASFVSITQQF